MISKLPSWFWCGTWFLAFVAGIINVIGLLGFNHQTVSHLTGNSSILAAAIATGDISAALHFAMVIGSFMIGAIFSGFVIQNNAFRLDHSYGITLLTEALLLYLAVPLLQHESVYGIYCLAGACGLQNAMVSTSSRTVVRTTHVSGMFTDLGIFLGHALRGLPVDPRRIQMCFLVISAFLCGGVTGAILFRKLSYSAVYIPAGITTFAAIICTAYQLFGNRKEG